MAADSASEPIAGPVTRAHGAAEGPPADVPTTASDTRPFYEYDERITYDELLAVTEALRAFPVPWFVCGGWAIDLFVGRITREHEDLEFGVLRGDQILMRDFVENTLEGPELEKSVQGPDGGMWVPWQEGEWLDLPIHQVRVRLDSGPLPTFEFFLCDHDDRDWKFRRMQTITRPLDRISQPSPKGIPIVAPEIQLLYKARTFRPKDEHDFAMAHPLLGDEARDWLLTSLRAFLPDHPWIAVLERR